MYDFLGCTDAMVLDEGYDVFFVRNPMTSGNCIYTNSELLERVLWFTKYRANIDVKQAQELSTDYMFGPMMEKWPLNKKYFDELNEDFARTTARDYSDIMVVTPNRSQIRSVLIFAVRESNLDTSRT
jgi:hypothetical protein